MKNHTLNPAIIIALSMGLMFYSSISFPQSRYLLLFIAPSCIIALLWLRPAPHTPYFKLLFCCCSASIAVLIAVHQLQQHSAPPDSLLALTETQALEVIFNEEPKAVGTNFYRLEAKILRHYTAHGSSSATGYATIFLTAPLIQALQSGGVTTIDGLQQIPAFAFRKGAHFFLHGHFSSIKNKLKPVVFFAKNKAPRFIAFHKPLDNNRAILRFSLMRILYQWGDAGGLLFALLAANRDFLSADCTLFFRKSGVAHILALSGMHLSCIGLLLFHIGKIFGGKKFALRLSLLALVFFVYFAGRSPSLTRALIMALLVISARLLGVKVMLLPILAFTFSLHLLFFPHDAFSLAFQLSYLAVTGIVLFSKPLIDSLCPFMPKFFATPLALSSSAFFATTPLVIFTFTSIAPIGIFATLFLSPLVLFFLIIGSLCLFLVILLPALSPIVGTILQLPYSVIVSLSYYASRLPLIAPSSLPEILFTTLLPLAGSCFCYGYAYNAKRRRFNYATSQLQFTS